MSLNKFLFLGLGGAGQRHLRIFKNLLPPETKFTAYRSTKTTPLLNENFTINRLSSIEEFYELELFDSLNAAFDDGPDVVVISTPSSLHFEAAKMAADRGIGVFVEKPFSHNLVGFNEFANSIRSNDVPFFISYQRRFHPLIQKAQQAISSGQIGRPFSAIFNVASYVPDWHGYEDFRNLYACRKDLGGGVLLTEIHEFDLCYWFFGQPNTVNCIGGSISGFDLEVEDTAHVLLGYPKLSVSVNLSFMQKHSRRDFQIAGTQGYLEWDQDGNRLGIYSYETGDIDDSEDPAFSNDDMFVAQAKYFLDNYSNLNTSELLEQSRASLAIVEASKLSMRESRPSLLSNLRES